MSDQPKKGAVTNEGKTKVIYSVEGMDNMVIVENKNDITKNDDASKTQLMDSKAVHATNTTCRIFDLLKKAGLPVAYERQLSDTEFLAKKCRMIALEVIARRYAVGSYLNRNPNLAKEKGEIPHRFHRLLFEFFLKTTGGKIKALEGNICGETPIDPETERHVDDPFISNPQDGVWVLKHPKYPEWDARSGLRCPVFPSNILPKGITLEMIEEITRKTFLLLEGAWAQLGCRLIDFKIEFGIDADGNLVIADVIDNDSWRLRTSGWEELSKQLFRDNADFDTITEKYALVAQLVGRMNFPSQAIVFWRGSTEDKLPKINFELPGITIIDTVKSGHKSPAAVCEMLEAPLAAYPEGGVIIALVGMSNGLGPILSARTSWPVIGVSITANEHPEDVWSSLRMPSQVPMLTVLSPKNAVLAALNILAQKNPTAYMHRQYAIEELEK